jgi:hypothetical protein
MYMHMVDASLDLEDVASDGEDGPPQALASSVVAGGVGAMDTLADMAAAVVDAAARVLAAAVASAVGAQGAAPVAEGAGDTEQRISRTVPGLPRGNLTVAVLKSRLQMYGGAMFVLDDTTRHMAPNEHIFNKGAIKRAELLDAWRRFMDTPGDQGGFDPARMLSDEDLVVRKAAPGSRAGTRRGARRGAAATVLGLCTDAYTTCCWEKLSQTEQKRLVDAVAEGVALGDARGANPTLTMSHLPWHRSSLASRMFAGVKQLGGMSTTSGQLSPGSRASLGRCEELVQEGGHRRWPSVGNISRASVQADIVVETGLPYAATLALRRSNIQGQAKAERKRKKKRKCGERGEEDDGDDWESDYEGVAGQESPGAAGRSGGVSLGDGNDAGLGNQKDAALDGE